MVCTALNRDLAHEHLQLANALRRIIISETPTMAIEHVFMVNNTGIINDEMLSHRLGLVPLAVNPHQFQYKVGVEAEARECQHWHRGAYSPCSEQRMCTSRVPPPLRQLSDEPATEANTIVLRLKVACRQLADGTLVDNKVRGWQWEYMSSSES